MSTSTSTIRRLPAPVARETLNLILPTVVPSAAPTMSFMVAAYTAGLTIENIAVRINRSTSFVHTKLRSHPEADELCRIHQTARNHAAWLAERRYWAAPVAMFRAMVSPERIWQSNCAIRQDWPQFPAFEAALRSAAKRV